MPAVDLTNFEVDPRIARLIPSEMASKHLVLPLKRDGRTLTVAMADPTAPASSTTSSSSPAATSSP